MYDDLIQMIGRYQRKAASLRAMRSISAQAGSVVLDAVVIDLKKLAKIEKDQAVIWSINQKKFIVKEKNELGVRITKRGPTTIRRIEPDTVEA